MTHVTKGMFATMMLALAAEAGPAAAQPRSLDGAADTTYRALFLQAAPGRLTELIELYRDRIATLVAAGESPPVFMRHSQGDHWDLMLLFPISSLEYYFSDERQARLGPTEPSFTERLRPLVAWQEELFVLGPPADSVSARDQTAGLYHVEIFRALPGRYHELVEQRQMENGYYHGTERDGNLVFTRLAGGPWDVFTVGFYRDLEHFAASPDLPDDVFEEAAQVAGFQSRGSIGTYLRQLISRHQDTLASKVPLR